MRKINKSNWIIFLVIAVVIAIPSVKAFGDSKDYDKTIYIDYKDEQTKYITKQKNVKDFLNEVNIEIEESYSVVNKDDEKLFNGKVISILPSIDMNLKVDDKSVEKRVKNGSTVSDVIDSLKLKTGEDYYYVDGDTSEIITPDKEISLLSRKKESFETTQDIEFKTIYEETTNLSKGKEKVSQEGVSGEKIITTEVVFYGGKEYLKEVIKEEVTKEPLDKIILVGIEKPKATSNNYNKPQNSNLNYSNSFTMSATAYTAGFESTGKNPGDAGYGRTASGMMVRPGVVAVDPNVIPLGTRLYIEGYGEAIAADTGGAIKGNKIDLYYESLGDAINFGRRNVNVYVLE